ncbi:MAG: hypothetical protein GY874_11895 [Desulfobacteraceae bacterium]|nr:hypothetical protein [Desulfobacteraceae bacterium]
MENSDLFFKNNRLNFFSVLTGRYREIAVSCIRNLYLRLNGPEADYGYHLSRKDVIDILAESIRITPAIEDGQNDEADTGGSIHERANRMLRRLKETGWIEHYMDAGNMQTAYRLTSYGRQFASPFAQQHSEIITNTQHTRSTLSHLQSFVSKLKQNILSVDDLMIAAKLSGEIICDFNEIIEEIVEQRRELIASADQEARIAKQAGENFFEFLEKRIAPDISVRFSQDSAERYKSEIIDLLDIIRGQPDSVKAKIEARLRLHYPNLKKGNRPSILLWAIELIEQRLTAACDVKMPELRLETKNFIKRAQVLIKHLASLAFGEIENNSIFSLVKRLSGLDQNQIRTVLEDPRSRHCRLCVEMVNPDRVRPLKQRVKRKIETVLEDQIPICPEEQRRAYIRQELAFAFRIETSSVSDFVVNQLAESRRIEARQFQIDNAAALLGALHAPMAGSISASGQNRFRVRSEKGEVKNDYYTGSNFSIEFIDPLTGEQRNDRRKT